MRGRMGARDVALTAPAINQGEVFWNSAEQLGVEELIPEPAH